MKTIIVDGFRFTMTGGKKYHYNSTIRKHLHQYIWEKANGKVPDGYEIHHKDLDTSNNDLSNLELMTVAAHKELHSIISWDEGRREWARDNLNKNARPKAIEWHKSEEGLKWHKEHYENMKELLHREDNMICECCGIEFIAKINGSNRFCSNKCKSKWRRDNGLDDVEKICVTCGNTFTSNKYSKTTNCSKSCAMKSRHSQNKLKDSPNLQE